MLIIEHKESTKANPEAIWKIWTDVEGWKKWDHELEQSALDRAFEVGAKGKLTVRGAGEFDFEMIEVRKLQGFKDVTKLFGAKMVATHDMQGVDGKLWLSHKMEVFGPLALFYYLIFRPKMRSGFPKAMRKLVELAESS